MRDISRVVLHCSRRHYGTIGALRKYHQTKRGEPDVLYHYLIENGVRFDGAPYSRGRDGALFKGRPEEQTASYDDAIEVCVIGDGAYTTNQMYSLLCLCMSLIQRHCIGSSRIFGHNEIAEWCCPTLFDMQRFRNRVEVVYDFVGVTQ